MEIVRTLFGDFNRGDFESAFERIDADVVSKGAGIEVEQRVAQLYELRHGKVTRVRQFRTRDEALAAS